MAKCSKCGNDLPPGAFRCPNCGASVNAEAGITSQSIMHDTGARQVPQAQQTNTGLILGIISIILGLMGGILGIVIGIVGMVKSHTTRDRILNGVGIGLAVVVTVVCFVLVYTGALL